MLDHNNFVELIKKAAHDENEASEPVDFCYGKVTNIKPLKIYVEQKMELGKSQLILTRNVTNFKTSMLINKTEPHTNFTSNINITFNNGLKVGDEVILLKKKGGQKYLVLDRMVNL